MKQKKEKQTKNKRKRKRKRKKRSRELLKRVLRDDILSAHLNKKDSGCAKKLVRRGQELPL
jgi:hypothetical protein